MTFNSTQRLRREPPHVVAIIHLAGDDECRPLVQTSQLELHLGGLSSATFKALVLCAVLLHDLLLLSPLDVVIYVLCFRGAEISGLHLSDVIDVKFPAGDCVN